MRVTTPLYFLTLLGIITAAGVFGPCPQTCECKGIVPGICTRCFDPNRNISTQCEKCSIGLSANPDGKCVPQNSSSRKCPDSCQCRGNAWKCTSCRDPNANVSTDCKECNSGYKLNEAGDCVSVDPQIHVCPYYCVCAGFVPWTCTRCVDPRKNLSSKCRTCNDGYVLNPKTQECNKIGPCPEGCNCSGFNPAGCVNCLRDGFDPLTKCTKCLSGYKIQPNFFTGLDDCRPICTKGCYCSAKPGCEGCIDQYAAPDTQCKTCIKDYQMDSTGRCVSIATVPGGITPQPDPTTVKGFDVVNAFVLKQHPELVDATITKLSTQVVAGTNYYITYETATTIYEIVVWEKVWENFMSITSFKTTPK